MSMPYRVTSLGLLVAAVLVAGGCGASNQEFMTEDRKANGLVIILPGIEGESGFNHDIRRGLVAAGVRRAMPIYSWGRPVPIAGPILNQVDVLGNRAAGRRIAQMIEAYQDTYPGRPVHLIGHSGGGGVAVFAAEAMGPGRSVTGCILLSASISRGYDLSLALSKCDRGIVNFYSRQDVGLLVIGTSLLSNVDGVKGPAAGNSGFTRSWPRLYQVELGPALSAGDAHSAATKASFVAAYVAPWVTAGAWPAGSSYANRPIPLEETLAAVRRRNVDLLKEMDVLVIRPENLISIDSGEAARLAAEQDLEELLALTVRTERPDEPDAEPATREASLPVPAEPEAQAPAMPVKQAPAEDAAAVAEAPAKAAAPAEAAPMAVVAEAEFRKPGAEAASDRPPHVFISIRRPAEEKETVARWTPRPSRPVPVRVRP